MLFNKKLLAIIFLLITTLIFSEEKKDKMKVVLDKGQYELYFTVSSGIRGYISRYIYFSGLGPELSLGFNQKIGMGKNIELDYEGSIYVYNIYTLFYSMYKFFTLPTILSNNDLIINIKIWNNEKSGFSVKPKIGLYFGWEFPYYSHFPNLYGHAILGLDIGVNLLGVRKSKKNNQKIYYGGSLSIKEDFITLATSYNDFLNNKNNSFIVYRTPMPNYPKSNEIFSVYLPLMYFNTGFIMGWETTNKYINKNEISFNISFGWFKLFEKYQNFKYDYPPIPFIVDDVSISLSYTFYFGKYYEKK